MAAINRPSSQNQRLEVIRQEIAQNGEVFIRNLSKQFKVSEMTIRRDLDLLESQGEVIRTHGGAASAKRFTFEFTFRSEHQKNLEQKQSIAKKALDFIQDGQTIILDTGTTTLEIARQLPGQRSVKVITVSLPIVSQLQFARDIEVILLGGFLRDGAPDLHGPLTEQNLEMFKADVAFLGAGGIDEDGSIYTDDLRVLNLDRKMVEVSSQVVVVADSTKFRRDAMCKVMGPDAYHVLITDGDADSKLVKKLIRKGIQVEQF
jgi:DeoR/GlpR family transcriptional regulator of sugar metabolism